MILIHSLIAGRLTDTMIRNYAGMAGLSSEKLDSVCSLIADTTKRDSFKKVYLENFGPIGDDANQLALILKRAGEFATSNNFDRMKPILTTERYEAVLKRIGDKLNEALAPAPADILFLAFWEIEKFGNKEWTINNGRLILDSLGDGNCFWYSVFGERPELLLKLDFQVKDIIEYIKANKTSKDAIDLVIEAKKRMADKVEKLRLDDKINMRSDTTVKNIFEAMFDDKEKELLNTDEKLKNKVKIHIFKNLEWADSNVSYLIPLLLDIDVSIFDSRNDPLNPVIDTKTGKTNVLSMWRINNNHFRRLYELK